MEKFEFSPSGLQALLTQLYALPDTELEADANLAAADFAAWVLDHFELSPSQIAFLQSLNPQFMSASGADTAVALRHRLPIYLIKPEPSDVTSRTDKLIRRKNKLEETTTGSGATGGSGDLTYEIID